MMRSTKNKSWWVQALMLTFIPCVATAQIPLPTQAPAAGEEQVTESEEVRPAGPQDRYMTSGFFYMKPDSARKVDYGAGVTMSYGGRWGERRQWEVRFNTNLLETGVPGGTDFYQIGLGLDVLQRFGSKAESEGHPYGLLGAAAIFNDVSPDDKDGINPVVQLGFGWRGDIWDDWGLRPRYELRYVHDTFDIGFADIIAAFVLEIPPKREIYVERIIVKRYGVPVEVIREVKVGPKDGDGDGVPDGIDKCPDTLPGAKVGPDGCVRETQVIELPNIEFEFEKAQLTAVGRERLEPVVRFLNDQPEVDIEIHGHTDSQGRDSYNLRLSNERAYSVRTYLIENGIAAGRLTAKGFGESKPIASNETLEGKARNRRVELKISSRAGEQ